MTLCPTGATPSEAEAFLAAHPEIEAIDLILTDSNGIARGKIIRRHELAAIYTSGRGFPISILGLDIVGEDVHEEAVVLLQDRVLGGELQRQVARECVAEAAARKRSNRAARVEHAQVDTRLDISDVLHSRLAAVFRSELDLDRAGFSHDVVLAAVLVSVSVSTDNDWLCPSWNEAWNA